MTQITAKDFLEDAFANLTEDEKVCVSRARWLSDGSGTYWQNYTPDDAAWRGTPEDDAWYVCVAAVNGEPGSSGKYIGRGRRHITRVHMLMFDDIGEKTGALPVEPSVKLETSPGSFQWLYFLSEPHEDLDQYEAFLKWCHGQGWGDGGAGGAYRVCRVPGSRNIKKDPAKNGFLTTAVEYRADREWTLRELASALGCDLDTLAYETGKTLLAKTGGAAAMENIDPLLDWLVAAGQVVQDGGGWVEVICPWGALHTTGSNTGGYSPLGRGDGQYVQMRSYSCRHEHCRERDLRAFLKYHAPAGAPQVSGFDQLPWLANALGCELDINAPREEQEQIVRRASHASALKLFERIKKCKNS